MNFFQTSVIQRLASGIVDKLKFLVTYYNVQYLICLDLKLT